MADLRVAAGGPDLERAAVQRCDLERATVQRCDGVRDRLLGAFG